MSKNKKILRTIAVDTERCKGCEVCIVACPADVLTLSDVVNSRGYPYAEMRCDSEHRCTGCASCGVVCPDGCITIYSTQ